MTVIVDEQPGRPTIWWSVTPGDEREAGNHQGLYLETHVGQLDQVGLSVAGERDLDWDEAISIVDHYDIADPSLVRTETLAIAAALISMTNQITTEQAAA